MKISPVQFFRALAVSAAAFAASLPAHAQQPGPAGSNPGDVKITKITDFNSFEQKAKAIDGKTAQKARKWGVFDVTFTTEPDWIDSMTVTYTVILLNPKADAKKGEKPMSLLQTTVEYADVEKGRDHKAGSVLLPAALLRFGAPLGFAVQISVGGQVVAEQGAARGQLQQQKEWWKNDALLNHPNIQRRDGYLVDRMKSPFSLVDVDDYERSR